MDAQPDVKRMVIHSVIISVDSLPNSTQVRLSQPAVESMTAQAAEQMN